MMTITNTTVARDEVWRAFHWTRDVRLRERYHGILLLMDGKSCPEIAQWLYRHVNTVRGWVRAFNKEGLPGLERAPIPGRPGHSRQSNGLTVHRHPTVTAQWCVGDDVPEVPTGDDHGHRCDTYAASKPRHP